MLVALTRDISPSMASCELTHLARVPIDVERARAQHREYEQALTEAGCRIERLASGLDMPDSVFVEDIAIAFDELAIVTRPGAEPRRVEVPALAQALERHRPLRFIVPPGTLDGGDVLIAGRRVFVGLSTRTNADAVAQMRQMLAPHGYTVCAVTVRGCLHLKSAVTAVADDTLLVNPQWIGKDVLSGFRFVEVDPAEPMAANALRVGDLVIYPDACPRTAERLARHGLTLRLVDASEVAKAEGAVTCCSVIFEANTDHGGHGGRGGTNSRTV
ncbi:MAG: dimethylargininase [Acidobacteria bacterium 13_1_40CM_4_65_8]|nr:MAG: dimethylargininase [Acidobacteria bacterium 13_1_40CM_4_65_8]